MRPTEQDVTDDHLLRAFVSDMLRGATPHSFAIYDNTGRIRFINEAAYLLLLLETDRDPESVTVEEFRRWLATCEGETLPPVTVNIAPPSAEVACTDLEGRKKTFLFREAPLSDAKGNAIGGYFILVDVSRQREMQCSLETTEVFFRTILDALPIGVAALDPSGKAVFENRHRREMWKSHGGEHWIIEEVEKLSQDEVRLMVASDEQLACVCKRLKLRLPSGTEKVIDVSSVPLLPDEQNDSIVKIEIDKDVTDEVLTHEEILRLNRELEDRVKQRTAELEEANKELESFSYSVSHDLRAPLRNMYGFAQILIRKFHDDLSPKGLDYLTRILRGVEKMEQLIDDILALSRIMRREFVREDIDLSAMANEVISELHSQELQRNVDVHIEPGLKTSGDRSLLRIVLENLLSNAWKFTGRNDSPQIGLQKEGEWFVVWDNGAGFDPNNAQNLFQPFQRLHTQEEFPGSGIGLTIVKRIITRHGGKIRATGEPGKGARFSFSLP